MAIISPLPITLTNGTLADANQVMADLNAIVSNVNSNGASLAELNADFAALTGAVVSSIASLRAVLVSSPGTAFVTGYYAAGDGGGGAYYYDSADVTSPDNGGTVIVAADGGRWKLASSTVTAKQFGCRTDGVSCTAQVGSYVAWAKASLAEMIWTEGTYTFGSNGTTTDGIAYGFMIDWWAARCRFSGKVILKYTGAAGYAVISEGGATVGEVNDLQFGVGCPPIIQAQGATGGFLARSTHRSDIQFYCSAAVSQSLRIVFAVCTDFFVGSAGNGVLGGWVQTPVHGIVADQRAAGEYVSACTFHNVLIEGVSGDGILLNAAQFCTFISGTSESNGGYGIKETSGCASNVFIGMDVEANNADFYMAGGGGRYVNCIGGSTAAISQVIGSRNVIEGGTIQKLNIQPGAYFTQLRDFGVKGPEVGGSFTDGEPTTQYTNTARQTYFDSPALPDAVRAATLKGIGAYTVTAATAAAKGLITVPGLALDVGDQIVLAAMAGGTWATLNAGAFQVEPETGAPGVYALLSAGAYLDTSGLGTYTGSSGNATLLAFSAANWGNTGGANRLFGFTRTSDGTVKLFGNLKYAGGGSGTTHAICTLPAGYRPGATLTFMCVDAANAAVVQVSITTGGVVTPTYASGASANISLDNVTFRAEA